MQKQVLITMLMGALVWGCGLPQDGGRGTASLFGTKSSGSSVLTTPGANILTVYANTPSGSFFRHIDVLLEASQTNAKIYYVAVTDPTDRTAPKARPEDLYQDSIPVSQDTIIRYFAENQGKKTGTKEMNYHVSTQDPGIELAEDKTLTNGPFDFHVTKKTGFKISKIEYLVRSFPRFPDPAYQEYVNSIHVTAPTQKGGTVEKSTILIRAYDDTGAVGPTLQHVLTIDNEIPRLEAQFVRAEDKPSNRKSLYYTLSSPTDPTQPIEVGIDTNVVSPYTAGSEIEIPQDSKMNAWVDDLAGNTGSIVITNDPDAVPAQPALVLDRPDYSQGAGPYLVRGTAVTTTLTTGNSADKIFYTWTTEANPTGKTEDPTNANEAEEYPAPLTWNLQLDPGKTEGHGQITIYARSYSIHGKPSTSKSTFIINVDGTSPTLTFDQLLFTNGASIKVKTDEEAEIFYTTDGTQPALQGAFPNLMPLGTTQRAPITSEYEFSVAHTPPFIWIYAFIVDKAGNPSKTSLLKKFCHNNKVLFRSIQTCKNGPFGGTLFQDCSTQHYHYNNAYCSSDYVNQDGNSTCACP